MTWHDTVEVRGKQFPRWLSEIERGEERPQLSEKVEPRNEIKGKSNFCLPRWLGKSRGKFGLLREGTTWISREMVPVPSLQTSDFKRASSLDS